jgi:hypothetical protein
MMESIHPVDLVEAIHVELTNEAGELPECQLAQKGDVQGRIRCCA